MFTLRSAPLLTLSCRLGYQNRLCFDLLQVRSQVRKVPLCSFQLQRPALPMLQLCSLCVSRGTPDEFQLIFLVIPVGVTEQAEDEWWQRIHIPRRVVRFAVAKALLSSPLIGNWPFSASTRSLSHFWYQHDQTRPGTARKRNINWVRLGKINTSFLSTRCHEARTSLYGEWMIRSSQQKKNI